MVDDFSDKGKKHISNLTKKFEKFNCRYRIDVAAINMYIAWRTVLSGQVFMVNLVLLYSIYLIYTTVHRAFERKTGWVCKAV